MIHEYFCISYEIIWNLTQTGIFLLKFQLEVILTKLAEKDI